MEEERAAQVDILAQLSLSDFLRAPRTVQPCIRHGGVRERHVQLNGA